MFGLSFQSYVLTLVPVGTAVAMSIFSGIYNIGIGSGAFLGEIITEHIGVWSVGYFGAALALLVCIYYKIWFMR